MLVFGQERAPNLGHVDVLRTPNATDEGVAKLQGRNQVIPHGVSGVSRATRQLCGRIEDPVLALPPRCRTQKTGPTTTAAGEPGGGCRLRLFTADRAALNMSMGKGSMRVQIDGKKEPVQLNHQGAPKRFGSKLHRHTSFVLKALPERLRIGQAEGVVVRGGKPREVQRHRLEHVLVSDDENGLALGEPRRQLLLVERCTPRVDLINRLAGWWCLRDGARVAAPTLPTFMAATRGTLARTTRFFIA